MRLWRLSMWVAGGVALVAALLCVASADTATVAAKPGYPPTQDAFTVGAWSGGVGERYTIPYCEAWRDAGHGFRLGVRMYEQYWEVVFYKAAWGLETAQVPSLSIDGRPLADRPDGSVGGDGDTVSFSSERPTPYLGPSSAPVAQVRLTDFRQGRTLTLSAKGGEVSFDLGDADGVVPRLIDCVDQHRPPQGRFTIGHWQGGADLAEGGGFESCVAWQSLSSGVVVTLALQDQQWSIFFDGIPDADATPGKQQSWTVRIDGGPPVVPADSVSGSGWAGESQGGKTSWFIDVYYPDLARPVITGAFAISNTVFDALRKGYTLRLSSPQQTYTFDLAGSNEVILRLADCVDRYWNNRAG